MVYIATAPGQTGGGSALRPQLARRPSRPHYTKPGSSTTQLSASNHPSSHGLATRRHEWHSDDDRHHPSLLTTDDGQATSDEHRPYPTIRIYAPAASSRLRPRHERQVQKEGRPRAHRPCGDVREPEEPHRGSRGRGGGRGGRGAEGRPRTGGKRGACEVHRAGAPAPPLICTPQLGTECSQFAEFKRMEREHQKEKQKLLKDKDAGASMHSSHPH